MTHKCVADGCKREISMAYVMCRKHWQKVPKPIQRAIWRTVGDRDRRLYLLHVREAIDAVSKAEGKQLELYDDKMSRKVWLADRPRDPDDPMTI